MLAVHRTGKHIVFELGSRLRICPRSRRHQAAAQENRPANQRNVYSRRAVDRAPGHDRPAAGHHSGFSRCSSHARAAQPGQRPGAALCGSAPLRPPGVPRPAPMPQRSMGPAPSRSPLARASLPRSSTPDACPSRLHCSTRRCSPGWATSTPTRACFRPASGRGGGPTASPLPNSRRLRLALRQVLEPRHPARRLLGLRLRRRRRRARLLSARALRLPAHRPALPPLPNAHPALGAGGPRNPLLPQVPALNRAGVGLE